MLFYEKSGSSGPLVIMLHWLGGSSLSWQSMSRALGQRGLCCVAFDLPGFGEETLNTRTTIPEMTHEIVASVVELRRDRRDEPWILAGHSMGGKLAMIIARMAADGCEGLENLASLILVSPSPPSPEPMSDKKRADLMKNLGPANRDAAERERSAVDFIDDNTGRLPLLFEVKQGAVAGVRRMNPDALMAWLTDGSREDWSGRVGTLDLPTLLFAGSEDKALGPDAQHQHTLPHLKRGTLVNLQGGGHLAPLERPAELVDRVAEFWKANGIHTPQRNAVVGPAMMDVILSTETSPRTREVLLARLPDTDGGGVFSAEELLTLRAVVARVVPNAGFDLAIRIDKSLAEPVRDGWRFDQLPPDREAWRLGIQSLNLAATRECDVPFVALDSVRQDAMLKRAQEGELGKGVLGTFHMGESRVAFDGDQMRDWFEDVRGELAKLYVADPRTMERIGFIGFADESGFTQIKLEDQEKAAS
jgi:pimeloyl-ACP methyl ester carboxylesterase